MDDRLARFTTIGIVIALMLVTAYHRVRARRAARRLPQPSAGAVGLSTEGRIAWLRVVGLVIWASLIGYLVDADRMAWSRLVLPRAVPWIGAALAGASIPAVLWVLHNLGLSLSSRIVPRAPHRLVQTGPYRWVRHPWYSALIVFLAGLTLLWSSWWLALLTLARTTYFAARSRVEERNLVAIFGDAYRDYARRVPRFLPSVRGGRRDPG